MSGSFVISLDFELYWGLRDKYLLENYKKRIVSTKKVIPLILKLFSQYNIHATWATVGFLFARDIKELKAHVPKFQPTYLNKNLSPYFYLESLENSKENCSLHCANELVDLIKSIPNQEVASHTFSHYYCLEKGQSRNEFQCDLESAINLARKKSVQLKSLVFPRNQFNQDYCSIARNLSFVAYRGNQDNWLYHARDSGKESMLRRFLRLLDSYANISGYQVYKPPTNDGLRNIKASSFLRPYSRKLFFLEWFKLKRIKDSMTFAARKGLIYHLWWHPHNFSVDTKRNLFLLEEILQHYFFLAKKYHFKSLTMEEIANGR